MTKPLVILFTMVNCTWKILSIHNDNMNKGHYKENAKKFGTKNVNTSTWKVWVIHHLIIFLMTNMFNGYKVYYEWSKPFHLKWLLTMFCYFADYNFQNLLVTCKGSNTRYVHLVIHVTYLKPNQLVWCFICPSY